MASIVNGDIDLLQLPFVKIVEMDDEEGDKQEYVCIPIKKAGLKRYKRKVILPFSVFPLKHPLKWQTHFVKPNWSVDFKKQEYLTTSPILGSALISFRYYEQQQPEPFKLSSLDDVE